MKRTLKDQTVIDVPVGRDVEPFSSRSTSLAPTIVRVTYTREFKWNGGWVKSHQYGWETRIAILGRRILKSGALGQDLSDLTWRLPYGEKPAWLADAIVQAAAQRDGQAANLPGIEAKP